MGEVLISLIVPTRGRPEGMLSFLQSVRDHASAPQNFEVVMVVDEDDSASQAITCEGLSLVRVVMPPGSTMGCLNMAGFRASRGEYIMLTNDDVRVRTSAWDDKTLAIFRSFPDEIVLVHVNDTTFEDKLCIFPFVSRRFCEFAEGICREEYKRYRIDDDIYHIFNLLALLGHKRIVYLPDVVFEHQNAVINADGEAEYIPIPQIHAQDTAVFNALAPLRKELAIRLAAWIDAHRRSMVDESRRNILAPYADAEALRGPESIRIMPGGKPASDSRVTIGVVSANLNNKHTQTCLDRLKKHTRNFDLIVLDNNCGPNFNHSREMNRLLEICRTDFLVLMDDDAWVTSGWLESMLSCIAPAVGVVTPLHLDRHGDLSYAGVVMNPDGSGDHSHIHKAPKNPTPSETLRSAVLLIDMTKVGHLRLDESYSAYFSDIDFGLRVWEAGFEVIVDSNSICTHLGGASIFRDSLRSYDLYELQRQHWVREWVDTNRFARLREQAWRMVPELREVLDFPEIVAELMVGKPGESDDAFLDWAMPRVAIAQAIPALQHYLRDQAEQALEGAPVSIDDKQIGRPMLLRGIGGVPTRINEDWIGYDIYVMGWRFYAVLTGAPAPTPTELQARSIPGMVVSPTLAGLRESLERGLTARQRRAAKRRAGRYYIMKLLKARVSSCLFLLVRTRRFLYPCVERETGKLLCTLGFVRVGTLLWDRAANREALRVRLETFEPRRGGSAMPMPLGGKGSGDRRGM